MVVDYQKYQAWEAGDYVNGYPLDYFDDWARHWQRGRPMPDSEIQKRAYILWSLNNKPEGKSLDYWSQAERMLR